MNKFIGITGALVAMLALSGCGNRAVINSGEVGKQLTGSGLEADVRDPGSFLMDSCFLKGTACPRLVRLETAVSAQSLSVEKVFLPKSNVSLEDVSFGIQYRIKRTKEAVNDAFRDIKSAPVQGSEERVITSEMVYQTYVQRKAPEAVIVALREFTVDEALSKPDLVAARAKDAINVALKDTPVEITEFGFPNGVGNPPQVVLDAKNNLYAIDEQKQRDLRGLTAQLEVEKQRQAVSKTRANNDLEIAHTLGIPVAQYQCLRSYDTFADAANDKGTTVYVNGQCGVGEVSSVTPVPVQVK